VNIFEVMLLVITVVVVAMTLRMRNQTNAEVAAVAAQLAPVFAAVPCDVRVLLVRAKGIKGTYRDVAVTAFMAFQGTDDLVIRQGLRGRPRWAFVLWADGESGAETWVAQWRAQGSWELTASDGLKQRLSDAGLLGGRVPGDGYGATMQYAPGFRRVIVGWPQSDNRAWPDAAEIAARLETLVAIVECNRRANAPV
jgi:hypothetical protein